jgi:hypothetical protein
VRVRGASIFLLLLLFPGAAWAQELRVYVMTVGPGELSYERFGHNAILFENPQTGVSVAYDWGRFDFDQANFIGRFIKGEMLYSTGAGMGDETLTFYVETQGRRVVLQELNLTQAQAAQLLRGCEEGILPENRDYTYDYFIANCSTELRDAIDKVLGGQIQSQLSGRATGTTYRREAERHLAPHWFIWFGVHAGLARPTDRPIDAWELTFLPEELRRWLAEVKITNEHGEQVPLVVREILLSPGRRAPPPAAPPARWWQTGLIGLLIAVITVGLARLRSGAPARIAATAWFLFAGFAGSFLLWIWLFSDHWAAYRNQTILLLSPLGLLLAFIVPAARLARLAGWLALVHLALCLIGSVLHFLPIGQGNLGIITFALPANVAAAWVIGFRGPKGQRPAAGDPAPADGS